MFRSFAGNPCFLLLVALILGRMISYAPASHAHRGSRAGLKAARLRRGPWITSAEVARVHRPAAPHVSLIAVAPPLGEEARARAIEGGSPPSAPGTAHRIAGRELAKSNLATDAAHCLPGGGLVGCRGGMERCRGVPRCPCRAIPLRSPRDFGPAPSVTSSQRIGP
jgi:hypothetical protein